MLEPDYKQFVERDRNHMRDSCYDLGTLISSLREDPWDMQSIGWRKTFFHMAVKLLSIRDELRPRGHKKRW